MPRGTVAREGAEHISANGYRSRKVGGKWIPVHIILMEKKLGRKLKEGESVGFIDRDKTNLKISNLYLREPRGSIDSKIASLTARRDELNHKIEELEAERKNN